MFVPARVLVGLALAVCLLASWGADFGAPGKASAAGPTVNTAGEPTASLKPGSTARPAGDEKLRLYFLPMGPRDLLPYRIDSVQPDGAIEVGIQIPEREAAQMARAGFSPAMLSNLTEGYLLGLAGLPEPESIARTFDEITRGSSELKGTSAIRVQVTEVQEGGKATVRVGPQAAAQLKRGDTLLLMRPPGSTTAQLQAVPEIVAITDARGEVLGMDPRMAARLAQSINNLKQIGLAMHNFHDTFKQFPPAVIYGPDGKPWHSWRVLLLPYLEQRGLYEQYKFDEPWDGPNNKRLLEKTPPVYRDPVYGDVDGVYTHYAVAVGKGTAFSPEGHRFDGDRSRVLGPRMGTPIRDFRDGTSNTVLVGSVSPDRKIPWTKPEDVVFDDDFPGIGKEGGFAAPYKTDTASGGVFLRADGSVTTICTDVDMEVLRNLIQIADGHPVPEVPTLEPSRRSRREQVAVIEIERTAAGPTAKLLLETLKPREEPPGVEPPVPQSEAVRKAHSANNLKQLALALHNYHEVHKSLPTAYSTDKDGNPLLSWRVVILPFIGQHGLYKQFRLDEPWDSEHNKKLIPVMPRTLRTPGSKAGPGKTNYLGVGGARGIFPGKDPIGFAHIIDGTSSTIMTVEVNDESAVIWTKPDDFLPDPENPKKGLLGVWDGGFQVGFADGSVRFFSEQVDDQALRALFTRDGREPVDPRRLDGSATEARRPVRVVPAPVPARPAPPPRPTPPPGVEEKEAEEEVPRSDTRAALRSRDQVIADIKKLGGKLLVKGYKASWSPDGKRIAFGGWSPGVRLETGGGIAVLDLETGQTTQLTKTGKDPAWSPGDGRFIAYVTGYGTQEETWVVEASGGQPRKLADGGFPAWSSDGKTVLFHSRTQRKLMAVPADAKKPQAKELIDFSAWYPAISLDGKQVAYRSGTSGSRSALIVASLETGNVTKILPVPAGGRGFLGAWSPDGKQVGFAGYGLSDTTGFWVVTIDSGQAVRLSRGPLTMPAWSPDGSKLAFDLRSSEGSEIWMIDTQALGTLEPEEVPLDRYAVPEGGIEVLLKFLQDLRQFRPRSAQEFAEHRRKSPAALKAAAQKILQLEKDQWSEAYQTALRVLLEDRVRTISGADTSQQRQTVDFVKTFLTAKLEKGIESPDALLAMSAARALEYTDNRELAAEAYQSFAELVGKSEEESLAEMAKMMEGAARRLLLLGKEIKLEGTAMDGTKFDWAAYRGKVVLVDFWATWCGPCRAELPNVRENYALYHDRGFEVVGISTDRDREALEKFLEKEQLPWVTLHEKDVEGRHPMATYYGVMAIPTVFLVDKEGKVVSLRARGEELGKLLQQLLGSTYVEQFLAPPYSPRGKLTYIDLQSKANRKLAETTFAGWEGNNLDELPRGEQTFGGVKFRIVDGLIQLAANHFRNVAEKVEGIPVNRPFARLYVFHGTQWGTGDYSVEDGTAIGEYRIRYEDGTVASIPIVYGESVRDWWNVDHSKPVSRANIAWEGANLAARSRDTTLRLYLTAWENPQPSKKVLTIDYVSTNTAAGPFCVAMTVEAETAVDNSTHEAAPDSPPQ